MASSEPRPSEASHKGRKLHRSANQLKRNAACLPCRRRRIKCDAGKPNCSSCVRNFHFLQRTQPDEERDAKGVQCTYEDADSGDDSEDKLPKKRKASVEEEKGLDEATDTVQRLEARVAELQAALLASANSSTPQTSSSDQALPFLGHGTTATDAFAPNPMASIAHGMPFNGDFMGFNGSILGDSPTGLPDGSMEAGSFTGFGVNPNGAPQRKFTQPTVETVPDGGADGLQGMDEEAGKLGGPFLDLIWPGWPPRLPTPAMLNHLVSVFFTSVPSIPRILHRQKFTARLALPPTHVDFPHPALLHALCAVSARYSAAVKVDTVPESIERYNAGFESVPYGVSSEDEIAGISCFAERNARYGMAEIRRAGMLKGRKFFEMVQAQLLLNYYHQQSAKWVDGWIGVGLVARACPPLGLMHEQEPEISVFSTRKFRQAILPPATEDWDAEERRAVMYAILLVDATFSSSSHYPGCVMVDELTALLPGSRVEFDSGWRIRTNPQSYLSQDIFINHPVEDPFVMLIKSMILLHRVGKFSRKLRLPGQGPVVQGRYPQELQQLDKDISDFNRTFPASLRDPLQPMQGYANRIDADLVAVHLLRRVVSILLHEPFAVLGDLGNLSTQRLLTNARACCAIVHGLFNTSQDIAFSLAPLTPSIWLFIAVRTILMFYQHALEIGDRGAARSLLVEVEICLRAFEALGKRLAIGDQQYWMLLAILDGINMRFGIIRPHPSASAEGHPIARPWNLVDASAAVISSPTIRPLSSNDSHKSSPLVQEQQSAPPLPSPNSIDWSHPMHNLNDLEVNPGANIMWTTVGQGLATFPDFTGLNIMHMAMRP